MVRAVLFDLDDTLYCECDFVRGGFAAVAEALQSRGVGEAPRLCAVLEAIHVDEGREGVLDKLAARVGFPRAWIPDLVERYRSHRPAIALAPDAALALARLRGRYRLGCVTDGWAAVQRRKIEALGLATQLDAIVVADDRGRLHWKPSPVPLLECCDRLRVSPAECVYVGDDPERDVRGARNAGIASVRLRRARGYFGRYGDEADPPDFEIASLVDLEGILNRLHGAGRAVDAPAPSER